MMSYHPVIQMHHTVNTVRSEDDGNDLEEAEDTLGHKTPFKHSNQFN